METQTSSPVPVPTSASTPAAAVAVPPAEGESTRSRNSGTNKAQALSLKKAEDIALAALSDAYRPALCNTSENLLAADHPSQLSPARFEALQTAVARCRADLGRAAAETASSRDATPAIDLAEERIVAAIQAVQKRARQKYLRQQPDLLAKYHVGARLDSNRANLAQFAEDIVTQLLADPLPGLTRHHVTELESARDAWKKEQARQSTAGEALRQSIREQLDHIRNERSAIQYAADELWPHNDPKNVETRKTFYLPLDRPLVR